MTIEQKIKLIKSGFKLLEVEKGYSQSKVVLKLNQLGCSITNPTFNKIIKNKGAGKSTITKVADKIQDVIKKELCKEYNGFQKWKTIENCTPEIIPTDEANENRKGLIIHPEGRLEIAEKVEFMASATKEVVEFGITLNTFSSYFMSRSPREFKTPLLNLLERGVDFKCYLLDPDWNEANMYFNDRKSVVNVGKSDIEKIRDALSILKIFSQEVASLELEGKFEVFKYRHLPNNYFLIVDKGIHTQSKMMVSNYLFGHPRAHCPVLEFYRSAQPTLFIRYLDSFEAISKNAKKCF